MRYQLILNSRLFLYTSPTLALVYVSVFIAFIPLLLFLLLQLLIPPKDGLEFFVSKEFDESLEVGDVVDFSLVEGKKDNNNINNDDDVDASESFSLEEYDDKDNDQGITEIPSLREEEEVNSGGGGGGSDVGGGVCGEGGGDVDEG